MSRPIYIITYYWPPAGGPGVQRWLKLAKYLALEGKDITVVIPSNADYPIIDQTLQEEVPDTIKILKVDINEPSRWLSKLSRKRTKKLQQGIIDKSKAGIIQNLLLWVRGNFFIPDARIGWKANVKKVMKPILQQHDELTVITTGPPHSVHLIGSALKANNRHIKWLADFRDPWTTIGYHKELKLTDRSRKKHLKLERSTLNAADFITVTSPFTAQEFSRITSKPIKVITNGYDVKVNEAIKQPAGKFTISHIGSLLTDRNPALLWECLNEIKSESRSFRSDLEIRLAGKISTQIIDDLVNRGFKSNLNPLGYMNHTAAYSEMSNSQILLLVEIDSEDTRAIIPGKLFEYLASRRPIVAIGPRGSAIEHIIEETKSGRFFDYSQKAQLLAHLKEKYQDYIANQNNAVISSNINQYHRKALSAAMSKTIDSLWG
ncbi:MAG: glycosyl transferase family 1 [Nonlabens sp.]